MRSENIVLRNMCNIAQNNPSRIGNNLRCILYKYVLNYKRVHMYRERDVCDIILNKCKEYICREVLRVGLQIRAIVIDRDSPQQWIL